MAAAEGNGGLTLEEEDNLPCSPRNKMKFLCSHGGKILPRPADGHLKYVGGETRVVAVPRDITFSELKERLSDLFKGDMVLKYQLIPEDLDTLVSVKTDEDLKHMLHEYNHQENQGSPKFRAFLFPSKPTIAHDNQAAFVDSLPHTLEQRYIDAINGIVQVTRRTKSTNRILTNPPIFNVSSGCSSPTSNSSKLHSVEPTTFDTLPPSYLGSSSISSAGRNMHRVQSSPSLCLPKLLHQSSQHHHHHHHAYQHHRPLLDVQKALGNERMASPPLSTLGRVELRRGLSGHGLDYYYTSIRHQKGSGEFDDFPIHSSPRRIDRAESLPHSPRRKLWE